MCSFESSPLENNLDLVNGVGTATTRNPAFKTASTPLGETSIAPSWWDRDAVPGSLKDRFLDQVPSFDIVPGGDKVKGIGKLKMIQYPLSLAAAGHRGQYHLAVFLPGPL